MNKQTERPPPISGRTVSSRKINSEGPKNPKVASALHKFVPANANITIGKIRQIGDSIPKLSDHADKLGIKLKHYDSPVLGIHGTIRGRAASANNRRKPSGAGATSTNLLTKFDDAVNNPEISLTRKISQDLQQELRGAKQNTKSSLAHSFLLGDRETIEEEMTKLHERVTSRAGATLGSGFELGEPKAIKGGHINVNNKNASSESQRSLREMNSKIDRKVTQWMKSNPVLEDKKQRKENQLVRRLPSSSLTRGDTKTERSYAVNDKLKEISNEFHKSLRNATINARDFIKTPDEDYVQELAKSTQDSLAKISVTEDDIDAVFHQAIQREKIRARNGQLFNASLSKALFKPLHTDLPTQKKLHNYVARRKEPFSPRPPRKDFENEFENPVELFKDVDLTDPTELRKRRSINDASEPQIFQNRIVDNGQLDSHRKIVDPNYRQSSIVPNRTPWDPLSINDAIQKGRGLTNVNSLSRTQDKNNQDLAPLKVTAQTPGRMNKDMAKQFYPNSRRDMLGEAIDWKLKGSIQNIEDATKVANALGSLMSKVALSDNAEHPRSMELTGRLQPPNVGAKSLRLLESQAEKRKGSTIASLAAELRQMAEDSERAYHAEMNQVQQKYTNVDEMKMQNKILKYSHKNNLSLLPGVSYTDQMLLQKLKSMENFPK